VRVRASLRARARAQGLPRSFLLSVDEKRMGADISDFRGFKVQRCRKNRDLETWVPSRAYQRNEDPEGWIFGPAARYLGSSSPLSEIPPPPASLPVPFGVSWSFQQIMAHLIVGILSKNARDIIPHHAARFIRIVPRCRGTREPLSEFEASRRREKKYCG